jgi:hypothetical protein
MSGSSGGVGKSVLLALVVAAATDELRQAVDQLLAAG